MLEKLFGSSPSGLPNAVNECVRKMSKATYVLEHLTDEFSNHYTNFSHTEKIFIACQAMQFNECCAFLLDSGFEGIVGCFNRQNIPCAEYMNDVLAQLNAERKASTLINAAHEKHKKSENVLREQTELREKRRDELLNNTQRPQERQNHVQ